MAHDDREHVPDYIPAGLLAEFQSEARKAVTSRRRRWQPSRVRVGWLLLLTLWLLALGTIVAWMVGFGPSTVAFSASALSTVAALVGSGLHLWRRWWTPDREHDPVALRSPNGPPGRGANR